MPISCRAALALSAAFVISLAGTAQAAPDDMAMGSAKAKLTLIEYASVTCPHCARWNNDVFPQFKAKYVDTGRVRYILRETPTDPYELAATGFIVARCAGPKYFAVIDKLMTGQQKLYDSDDARTWLLEAGAAGGLTEPKMEACLKDETLLSEFNKRQEVNGQEFDIDGTPTFILNGKKIASGELSFKDLEAAIAGDPVSVKKGPMTFLKGLFHRKKST